MVNRRIFLMQTAALPLAAKGAGGANDRINVGVIGLRGRGRDHITNFIKQDGCRVAALCDIDDAQIARGLELTQMLGGGRPKTYRDLRRLFDDKEIDVVSIATPNHWHALATVWGCQAGKDVYVEKPACHDIAEGPKMIEAARKYDRIVQVGLQSHSLEHYRAAIDLVLNGGIGEVYLAKGLCFKRRHSIGRKPDGPVPAGVDYDLWTGPAEMRPFNPNRFHYNWHWFWNTGNGDIGNQGVHETDIARWGLNGGIAPKVFSTGAKFIYDDDQETPNTQIAVFRYPRAELIFEVRGLMTNGEGNMMPEGNDYIGVIFLGSEASLTLDSNGFKVFQGDKREITHQMKYAEDQPWSTAPHIANFLKAVRSRRREDLNCDIAAGCESTLLVHIANISYRLGREVAWDSSTNRFAGDDEANAMMSRQYRTPFVLPKTV